MNFTVRYKWALRKDFQEVTAPDPFFPDYERYLQEERQLLKVPEVMTLGFWHHKLFLKLCSDVYRMNDAETLLVNCRQLVSAFCG